MSDDELIEQLVFKCSIPMAERLRADARANERSMAGQVRHMLSVAYKAQDDAVKP